MAGYGPMVPLGIAPNGQPLANFVDRLLAYLIDSAILFGVALVVEIPVIIIAVLSLVHSQAVDADGTVNDASPAFFLAVLAVAGGLMIVNIAVTYVYHVEMMYRSGQTVGKRAMKLRIVCLDPGTPMTRATAAKRWLIGQVATAIVGIAGLIDGLWQLWDQPYRQCLHDKVARTVVVKQAT
ncbi:MAG TPA: RDD family protein [Rugosimonospora sp.]